MNNTIYLLNNDSIFLYTDLNYAIIKLLDIIKQSLENNKINDTIKINCYLNNSNIIYNTYYFNFNRYTIQDNNNVVKLTNEFRFIQNNLIKSIKELHENNDDYKNDKSEKIKKLLEEKKKYENNLKQMKDNINNERKELDKKLKIKDEENIRKKEFDASLKAYFLMKYDIDNNNLDENDINPLYKISYNIFNELNVDVHNIDEKELLHKYYEKYKYYKNIDMIKNYIIDKNTYSTIFNNIKENKIYENNISKEFELKYKIFNNMKKNNILNSILEYKTDMHNTIKEEYNKYIEICNSINKYEPHNKNYIDNNKNYDEEIQKIINQLS